MDSLIFFHEDFYNQIELTPEENYFKVKNDLEKISIDKPENGFIQISERTPAKIKIEDKKINLLDIQSVIEMYAFKYFSKVETGYGNSRWLLKNTIAFGFERLAMFIKYNDDDNIITNIWICPIATLPQNLPNDNLEVMLNQMGQIFKFILIDWDEEIAIWLSSSIAIKKYLYDVFGINHN